MAIASVLVTGMSATGKSTVLEALGRHGHRTVDTDHDGWIVDAGGEPVWDEPRMAKLLADPGDATLYVAGCAMNQGRFYDRFDAVVLLSAPREVLVDRLGRRTGNPFGKRPGEREKILADLDEFEPRLRRDADHELVTTRPLGEVVAELERIGAESR